MLPCLAPDLRPLHVPQRLLKSMDTLSTAGLKHHSLLVAWGACNL